MSNIYKTAFKYGIGNIFIWYSYTLFMPFFLIISHEFFPSDNKLLNMIIGFAVFGVGLITRPIGSYIFGKLGDCHCREKSVGVSVLLLIISTVTIGLLPSYEKIGITSSILLTIARALQGVAMGGAGNISLIQMVELVPDDKKGLAGCIPNAANLSGLLISNFVFSVLYHSIDDIQSSVFWRLPFIFSLVLIPFAMMQFRSSHCTEDPVHDVDYSVLKNYKLELFGVFCLTAYSATCYYSVFAFLPNYMLSHFGGGDIATVTGINLFLLVAIFFGGYISDKFGHIPVLKFSTFCGFLASVLVFFIGSIHDTILMLIPVLGLGLSAYYGVSGAFSISLFPKEIRCFAVAIPMSLSQAIFGGLIPVVATKLTSHSFSLITIPLVLTSLFAIISVIYIKRKHG